MLPISYSVGHEYLHHILAGYKRLDGPRAEAAAHQLASILDEFLRRHEACLARAAGVAGFQIVTTVPSSQPSRDFDHPLRRVVSQLVSATQDRHQRLLRRSALPVQSRHFDARRFEALSPLPGQNVLLVDDTWTTGASAQSAAAALRSAGVATVAAVVIGRYVNRPYYDDNRLIGQAPFTWETCALCANGKALRRAA